MQQNSKYRLYGDRDETINHIISKCSKLANFGQKTRAYDNQQKKREFAKLWTLLYKIKLKECEKKDKYLDLARELKKLWNMKVTIILIVIGAFGTVTKGLLKGLEDL